MLEVELKEEAQKCGRRSNSGVGDDTKMGGAMGKLQCGMDYERGKEKKKVPFLQLPGRER